MRFITILGSVNADHVLQVPQFPKPGETLTGSNYQVIAGGKGANQALAVIKSGGNGHFISCIGQDSFGQTLKQHFANQGMNTDAMICTDKAPTGIAMIQVSASGENCICLSPEANAYLTPKRIAPYQDKIAQASILLMQLETPIETIEYAAKLAHAQKTKVVLNPAPAQKLSATLLKNVSIITPNETEAEVLTGIKIINDASAQAAANYLHQQGVETVIITLGKRGAWISHHQIQKVIKGFVVTPVDTTAAGDTFNGALVTALEEHQPLEEAIRFAHAAAALSVTRFGAQTSIPTRKEIDAFLLIHQSQP